jgi:DNA-binding GntR family transcriptional regulator
MGRSIRSITVQSNSADPTSVTATEGRGLSASDDPEATTALTSPPARDGVSVAEIHAELHDSILRGEIAPGTRTTQVRLARQLGVGRNPVREALRILQCEGLAILEPNHRVQIAELSGDDAEGLYVMRIALETTAARITVPLLQSADIAELEGLLAQHEHYLRVADRLSVRVPHRAFHQRLVGGVHDRVSQTIGELFDHAERYRTFYGGSMEDVREIHHREHRAILDAATARDADATVDQLARHYARAAIRVFKAIDPTHDPSKLRTVLRSLSPSAGSVLDEN